MDTYLFYTRQTESEHRLEELSKRLADIGVAAEMIDADSPRGSSMVELYDLMARPTVVVVRNDGQVVQAWTDPEQLPTPDEISYFAHL